MAEEIIAEIVIEAAVEELLNVILDARTKAFNFEAILTQLQNTLEFIIPKINEINQLKESNDFPTDDIQRLRELLLRAKKLVNECSEIAWWNYCKKLRYSKKLLVMDASLRRMLAYELPVAIWVDTTCIMFQFKELIRRLDPIIPRDQRNADGGCVSKLTGLKVLHVVSGFKKVLKALPKWIVLYLSSFTRRITWHGNQKNCQK